MHHVAKITALLGLAITVITPILTALGTIDLDRTKSIMLIGMIVWFLGATPWLAFRKLKPTDSEVEI